MDSKYTMCLLVVCVLAVIVIVFGIMLNRREKALSQCQKELKQLQRNRGQYDT